MYKQFITGVSVAAIAVLSVAFINVGTATAQGKNGAEEKTQATTKSQQTDDKKSDKQTTKATSGVTYKYVAQPGDTYSQLARKAVQTYGLKYKVNLSQAEIIYAETLLTNQAGSPYLNEGEVVTIAESAVKDVVQKAQKLSAEAEAAWQQYVPRVDFNTDNIGE